MMDILERLDAKKVGIFAAGVLFGTAGVKILSSKDAKRAYVACTAAVLRARGCVMKTVTTIQENAEDIYAEAVEVNKERAAAEDLGYEDRSEAQDSFKEVADREAGPEKDDR